MLLLIAILCLLLIYYKLIRPHNYWKDRGVEYIKPWPIFGNFGRYALKMSNITDTLTDLYNAKSNSRYVGFYQFQLPALMIRDPELIKQITVKEFDSFSEQSGMISTQNDNLAKKALFSLNRETGWQDMRSILSPAFTSSKMKMMFGLMEECSDNLVNYFLQQQDEVITVEVVNTFNRITNDIIASTAFGVQCDSLKEENNEFYLIGRKAMQRTGLKSLQLLLCSISPIIDKLVNVRFIDAEVEAFFIKVIKEAIKYREENNVVRHDMLHLLLEARKNRLNNDNQKDVVDLGFSVVQESELTANKKVKAQLTDEDITAQAFIFFLAGSDPSSMSLSFMSHNLALNPAVQRKLQQEIDQTFLKSNGKITYEALLKMKYLDCVVTETLRSRALILTRKATKSFTIEPELPGETPVHLEKGSIIWIPNGAIHHDPKYFPNPEKFDPERFNDENKHKIIPGTYIPFGIGPRNCIGSRFGLLQIKVIMVKLLKEFDIVPVEKTVPRLKPSKGALNLLPNEGVWLGFIKRKE